MYVYIHCMFACTYECYYACIHVMHRRYMCMYMYIHIPQSGNCSVVKNFRGSMKPRKYIKRIFSKDEISPFYNPSERSHDDSLLRKIREDVDDLYKWQTFRPSGLHQRQISHADNNITIIHNIYWVFIFNHTVRLIVEGGASFGWKRRGQADGLKTVGC